MRSLCSLLIGCLMMASVSGQNPEIIPQTAHHFSISQSRLHPNGRWLATGSADQLIKLWDIYEGKLLRTFQGHFGDITSIDFHPNPDSLYMMSTADDDSRLIIWDLEKGGIHQILRISENFAIEQARYDVKNQGGFYYLTGYKSFTKVQTSTNKTTLKLTLPAHLIDGDENAGDKTDGLYGLDKLLTAGRIQYLTELGQLAVRYYSKIYFFEDEELKDSLDCLYPVQQIQYNAKTDRLVVVTTKQIQIWDKGRKESLLAYDHEWEGTTSAFISESGRYAIFRLNAQASAVYDINRRRVVRTFKELDFNYAAFVQDDKFLVCSGGSGQPVVISVTTGKERQLSAFYNSVSTIALSPDQQWLAIADGSRGAKLLNRSNLKIEKVFETGYHVDALCFSPNGKYLATGGNDLQVRIWDIEKGEQIRQVSIQEPENGTYAGNSFSLKQLIFDKDNIHVYTGIHCNDRLVVKESRVYKVNWKEGRVVDKSDGFPSWIGPVTYDSSSNKLAVISSSVLRLLNVSNMKVAKKVKKDVVFYDNVVFGLKGKYLLASAWGNLFVWDYPSMKLRYSYEINVGYAWALSMINDSIVAYAGGFGDYGQYFLNVRSGEHTRYESHTNRVNTAIFTGKELITSSMDGSIVFRDPFTRKILATVFSSGNNEELLLFNPEGYYMVSRDMLDYISYTHGTTVFNVELFDLEKNRPDIFLETIGFNSQENADWYKKMYEKRLINSGSPTHWNSKDIPKLVRINLPFQTLDSMLEIPVKATGNSSIEQVHIRANGVPVFGKEGFRMTPANTIDTIFVIPLTKGLNRIEYSVQNTAGMRSENPSHQIQCDYEFKRPRLFILTLSVSEYVNRNYNLKYAVKDGRDFSKLLGQGVKLSERFGNQFSAIYVDTLFNEQLTREAFEQKAEILKQAGPNDRVIIYLSGHGLLDKQLNFWFATHDMDFDHPEKRGLSYARIDQLLDEIAAREKLLLMDACHSGQSDKSEQLVQKVEKHDGVKVQEFRTRGTEVIDEDRPALNTSMEMMQLVFRDLSQSSGTQVISAAAGNSYALESDVWNNGIFTFCLLNGIKEKEADFDEDGMVRLDELQKYVIREVEVNTNGRQKPTSRSWNRWANFRMY